MSTQLERIEGKLDKALEAIYGNGKDGLMTRVKEVETAQKGDIWRWRLVIGGGVALVVRIIYQLISANI